MAIGAPPAASSTASRAEAERLLIEAFLADPIDAIGDEAIATALKGTIGRWLARRGGES